MSNGRENGRRLRTGSAGGSASGQHAPPCARRLLLAGERVLWTLEGDILTDLRHGGRQKLTCGIGVGILAPMTLMRQRRRNRPGWDGR
jgi:hypothetical protein